MNILIRNKDLGFWTQEPITVQRFETINIDDDTLEEESVLVYCDHAQAEEMKEETLSGYVCDIRHCYKCGASRMVGDLEWQGAPVEGDHGE